MADTSNKKQLSIDQYSSSLICGRKKAGKSFLIRSLVYDFVVKKQYADYVIVFTQTKFNGDYEKYLPSKYIHTMNGDSTLKRILRMQLKKIKEGKPDSVLLILDDCLGMFDFNSKLFKAFFSTSRHYKITVLISVQHVNAVPPILRTNAEHVFVLGSQTKASLKATFETFGDDFENLKEFEAFVIKNTKDFNFVFINKNEGLTTVCKAKDPPPYRLEY